MLSVRVILQICGLKVVVSLNFALSAPHVKRRVKSCEPSAAAAITGPRRIPHIFQWRGALMFSFRCVWINDWVNNREAGDLRRHRGHHDVNVMFYSNRDLPLAWSASPPHYTHRRSCLSINWSALFVRARAVTEKKPNLSIIITDLLSNWTKIFSLICNEFILFERHPTVCNHLGTSEPSLKNMDICFNESTKNWNTIKTCAYYMGYAISMCIKSVVGRTARYSISRNIHTCCFYDLFCSVDIISSCPFMWHIHRYSYVWVMLGCIMQTVGASVVANLLSRVPLFLCNSYIWV